MKIPERLRDLADRAAITAAEGALLGLGAQHEEVMALDAFAVDWTHVGGFALGGAVLSVCINVARGGLSGRINLRNLD